MKIFLIVAKQDGTIFAGDFFSLNYARKVFEEVFENDFEEFEIVCKNISYTNIDV